MYLHLTGEEDKKMTDNWKGDADGILIFVSRHSTSGPLYTLTTRPKTGLFSAAVATLVGVSLQDLKPSSQDISAFYLANIYQILADPNGSQFLIPPTLPNPSIPFYPPTSAVWVNSLWFLSLVISLTCALLATLLQQWARRYMRVIQTRYAPHKRARIRAFFAEGVDKLHLPWTVEALPALLHLSLFLFFAGLAVFLFNINHTVFKVAISWMVFCTSMYISITFMPMFRHDSPYYAPLSSSAWYLYNGILFTLLRILRWIIEQCFPNDSIHRRVHNLRWTYWDRTLRGTEKEFEQTALKAPSEIDGRALMWTYESLDEDRELEQFFAGIPGFCSSKVVDNPQSSLDGLRNWMVAWDLNTFLEHTWTSNLVSESIKIRRLVICIKAIDAAHLSEAAYMIVKYFFGNWPALFGSIELGHSLMSLGNNDDPKTTLLAQGIISCIIAKSPQRNERWFSLTMQHLGISEHVLQSYLDHGDSVLLATLIHFTHQFIFGPLEANRERLPLSTIIWWLGMDLNVQDTLPRLQHDFCDLWNKLILQSHDIDRPLPLGMLEEIYPIYDALHLGSTLRLYNEFQLCSIPSHRVDSASNLNEVEDGRKVETARAPITTCPVPPVIPPATEHDAPPSTMSNLVDDQSCNAVLDNITPVASSFRLVPIENDRISDGTAADPIQGTTDPSTISSMINTGFHSISLASYGTALRPTSAATNMATSSFVPDTVPSLIPVRTIASDPAAPHTSANSTVDESGHPVDDGSTSPSSSQIFAPFPLASQVISGSDSKTTLEVGPLAALDDTLDRNRLVVSQSPTQPFPDTTADSLRLEPHGQAENLD